MSEPFVGEIKMFAGTFSPRSYAFCDGQLLAISQNDALFSLLGTLYGGDGRTTFGLPDLRGRVPIHTGNGPGLTPRAMGQKQGSERATVSVNELPSHTHLMQGSTDFGGDTSPADNVPGTGAGANLYNDAPAPVPGTLSAGGGGHNNMQPYLTLNFVIALQGLFPSRN